MKIEEVGSPVEDLVRTGIQRSQRRSYVVMTKENMRACGQGGSKGGWRRAEGRGRMVVTNRGGRQPVKEGGWRVSVRELCRKAKRKTVNGLGGRNVGKFSWCGAETEKDP